MFWGGKTMINSWFNYVFGGKPWLIRGLTVFGGKTMVNLWFNYVFGGETMVNSWFNCFWW